MNVTGQEVATGIADPIVMFGVLIVIFFVAGFAWVLYQIFT